ncbi:MAG: glycoside hydrolase family 5 protein [Defluviitaleaceae bacterium]|nr:glycoside hydrolase family 5 protein [Defluviitaleaceae bacterium]
MKYLLALLSIGFLLAVLAGCAPTVDEHHPHVIAPATAPLYVPPPPQPTDPPPMLQMPFARFIPMQERIAPADVTTLTATEFVAGIRMGWNLGNTLDANASHFNANSTVQQMETAWVSHVTTRANIEEIAAAGFNVIRIPVTWMKAVDDEMNIRADWMARVQEIVDWSLDVGMKVLLNTHHDNTIFPLRDAYMDVSTHNLERIWAQIAYHFRDYDGRLVFIGLNEPRTYNTPAEWSGGTPEERANLNILNQLFVDTVRATGGQNAYRILMVPTYAASTTSVAMRDFVLPTDTIEDRLIVALHIYAPWNFALRTGDSPEIETQWNPAQANAFTTPLREAYDLFVSQNIPVIIAEMGALNRGYEETRAEWAYDFVSFARSLSMPSVWWDNGSHGVTQQHSWGWDETFGLLNRATNTWAFPMIVDALMRAAG